MRKKKKETDNAFMYCPQCGSKDIEFVESNEFSTCWRCRMCHTIFCYEIH